MVKIKPSKLIGRDNILQRKIYPRLREETPFVLIGQKGIGKTELLKWAYYHYQNDKVYLSCNETRGTIVKRVAKKLGVKIKKKTIAKLEQEVLQVDKSLALFVDDLENVSPKQVIFLTALNNWNKVYLAGVGPFKERIKKLLWGKKKIKVTTLKGKDRLKLAKYATRTVGSLDDPEVIAQESKGVPGRAWALAKGEVIKDGDERVEGEEVNIAPIMLVGVIAIMITRYVALGIGERDLYVLAGIGMACSYLLRYVIRIVSK